MLKRNDLSSHQKTQWNLKCILLHERKQFYKSSYYTTLWKRQNSADKKRSVIARGWRNEAVTARIGGAQRIFRAVEILCIISHWWIYDIIHLYKSTECITPRPHYNINCSLRITMCQCRGISYSKSTALGRNVGNVGGYVWGQGREYMEIFCTFTLILLWI